MKYVFFTVFLLLNCCCFAQSGFEISNDPKHPEVKVLRGNINKFLLIHDTSFKWYKTNQAGYLPDTAILNTFVRNKNKLQFVLFGGTWCDDTQFILPRFFKIQEMAEVPEDHITFFGVNRDKKALGNIAAAFDIINVPTIIVMEEGKELGRVVEYGKTGNWDKELADIINKKQAK